MINFPANCVRLCFNQYEQEELSGIICGVALKEEISFSGIADFIVKIDDAFNLIGRPQPFCVLRSFEENQSYQSYVGNPKVYNSAETIAAKKGDLFTVDFIMTSRQKAEWQGLLKDIEGKPIERFETILQCIKILKKFAQKVVL